MVREPDTLIFGLDRVDPPEQEFLAHSPMRHNLAKDIQGAGATKAASNALAHLHADTREFMLHLDLDVIAQEEFAVTNVPGSGGLSLAETQTALTEFVKHKNLLGLDVAQYNPDKDADGSGARKVVDLVAEVLSARLAALSVPGTPATTEETPSPTA